MTSVASLAESVAEAVLGFPQQPAATDELRNREHFHRELLEALPAAIYTTDAAGRVTFYIKPPSHWQAAGRSWGRIDGASAGASIGRTAPRWRMMNARWRSRCGKTEQSEEGGDCRAAGWARIPILPYPTPLHDESGKLVGAVNMLVEISDRKKAEQTLRQLNTVLARNVVDGKQELKETFAKLHQSERDFRMLVQGVTDYAIFMLNQDGFVINWNAGAERIKGYEEAEIIGQHFSRFYTEEDRARRLPQRALATAACEGRYEAEGWRVRKDGRLFWASVIIDRIHDDAGRLVGFAKVTRDITERQKAQEALAESAELARGIIDSALDAFVQIDDTGTVLEWNAQAEAVFGWSRQDAVGKSWQT